MIRALSEAAVFLFTVAWCSLWHRRHWIRRRHYGMPLVFCRKCGLERRG